MVESRQQYRVGLCRPSPPPPHPKVALDATQANLDTPAALLWVAGNAQLPAPKKATPSRPHANPRP